MPTDRSIPPAIMTMVIPTATIPGRLTCWRMLRRFTGLRKVGYFPPEMKDLEHGDDDDEGDEDGRDRQVLVPLEERQPPRLPSPAKSCCSYGRAPD